VAMHVSVDADECVGHGRCYEIAPDVFAPDDHGHCVVIARDVPERFEEVARQAAAACPEEAISVSAR
jgi:ferredoxin